MGILKKIGSGLKTVSGYDSAKKLAQGDVAGALGASLGGKLVKGLYGDSLSATSTKQVGEDRARSLGMYDQFMQERGSSLSAPERITAEQEGQAPTIQAADPGAVERAGISTAGPAERVDFNLDPNVERVAADSVNMPKLGAASTASTAGAVASRINDAQGQQVRGQQMEHVGMLTDAAYGRAPSVAEAQLNKALGRVAQEQMGVVGQTRGTERAGARREAMLAMGQQMGDVAADKAALRAGEMATARGQLGDALGNIRGLDTSVASQQAQLDTGISQFNAGSENQIGMFNAGQTNDMERFRVGTDVNVQQGNVQNRLTAALNNQQAANQRAAQVAAGQYQAGADNANRTMQGQQFNAGQVQQGQQFNAGQANTWNQQNAARQTDVNAQNVTNTIGVGTRNTALRQDTNTQNQQTQLQTRGQDIQRDAGYRGDALQAANQAAAGTQAQIGVTEANKARRAGVANNVVGGVAQAGQMMLSDERAKTDMRELRPDDRLSNALKTYEFGYKGDDSGTKYIGHSAQQLERHPATARHVDEGPDGLKRVDMGGITNMLLLEALKAKRQGAQA